MSLKDKAVFPFPEDYTIKGLSFREYAAVAAMQGLCANHEVLNILKGKEPEYIRKAFSSSAVEFADDLIAELEKAK